MEQKRLDRPFGMAQGKPELREKIRSILLAFSDKWNGMCMISCHYLPNKRMWENCQFRSDCQDDLIDLLLALIPDIEEAKKQERQDIANQIRTILAENRTWATLKRSLVNFWQALKEEK